MIFAFDMDQTMIFSRNSMGPADETELVPVESIDGKEHSFMTRKAAASLRGLHENALFVPATTRTPEQYERIHGVSADLRPRYAVVSNGGRVLVDGQSDVSWENGMKAALRSRCAPREEIDGLFDKLVPEGMVRRKDLCDGLFYSILVDRERIPIEFMEELTDLLRDSRWTSSLQGRKLYLVPEPVSKGAGLRYVKELAGASFAFAAGDSLLDESLLEAADDGIAPRHGELFRKYGANGTIKFTQLAGIGASEEILEAAAAYWEVNERYVR
ncbi:HAD family hydrolase [Cohnella suwonensis]|uniref:HAD family hydrolase n=1 Tax=Cohnella suwonensis TaxID=696072 RepID=A0ABW0LU43_9BACL